MALTQSEIQSRLTALKKARDSGILRLRHGDEETWFRTLDEMNSIIAGLEAQISGATKRKKLFYPRQDSKGY